MEFRIDALGRVSNVKRTPQGGLEIPANLTRTGVFVYRQPDGSIRREYRPEDEVFNADSLSSLRGAPLTVGHPGIVRAENWQQVSVGHVGDDVRKDSRFVAATTRVQSAPVVSQVERKELIELSCGYTCDLDHTSGEVDGERYDAIQRNIRYNHVALLPPGGGRAGTDVCLRLDSKYFGSVAYTTDMNLEEALKEIDRLNGQLAAEKQRADSLDKSLKGIDVEALIQDRVSLHAEARTVLGEDARFDGKSPVEIMKSVVTKANPDLRLDGKSEDFVRGFFQAAVAQASKEKVAKGNLRIDESSAITDAVAEARKRNEERSQNGWKGEAK